MTPHQQSILNQKIGDSAFSEELKAMARLNNFETLADVLATPFHQVHALPLSDYRIVKEILVVLQENDLMGLVE
jgi:hypothetical protein